VRGSRRVAARPVLSRVPAPVYRPAQSERRCGHRGLPTIHTFPALPECREASLGFRIVLGERHEHADAPQSLALLRARYQRPRGRRAPEQRDELASSHSITSSARTRSVGGTSKPSIFAVFRLSTVSYLVGACTGSSAGLAPRRMRST